MKRVRRYCGRLHPSSLSAAFMQPFLVQNTLTSKVSIEANHEWLFE